MRELEVLAAMTEIRNVEIWALDQDAASIEECLRSYSDFKIVPLNKIGFVPFADEDAWREILDLIYSAGLADYLQDKTLIGASSGVAWSFGSRRADYRPEILRPTAMVAASWKALCGLVSNLS